METRNNYQRGIVVILLLSTVAFIIYLISIYLAYPLFQNTRLIDPLAEMHVLFPLYYVAIVLIAVAGFFCFAWRINNKGIHLLLLFSLGIMLWYTPHYMAEFSHNPDVARDIGLAMHISEILNGEAIPFSWYGANYPSSYVFSWLFLNTTGIGPLNYMLLFPLLCICMFVLLGYAFTTGAGILYVIFREYASRDSLRSYLIKLGGLTRNQVLLIINVFALLVFTVLLV